MKILANKYQYKIQDMVPSSVKLDLYDPAKFPENVTEYDAFFVNTTTKINERTLPETGNLSFIATGSAGIDHLDLGYLKSKGIRVANATGCNAKTVAEYVLTSLLLLEQSSDVSLSDSCIGLIGKGNIGTEVSKLLNSFSIQHIVYDPPKELRKPGFKSATIDEIKTCNILTFHIPMVYDGNFPTYHLLNEKWFDKTAYDLIINTARGEVLDEDTVIRNLDSGNLQHSIIDVWNNEPDFNTDLVKKSFIATPHIAGYSVPSKIRASKMIIDEFCDHANLEKPQPINEEKEYIQFEGKFNSIDEILSSLHPIKWYDKELRKLINLPKSDRRIKFERLRSETPLRHEYTNIEIHSDFTDQFPQLPLLGISKK